MSNDKVYYATGKRKTSAARVFLKEGTGKVTINGKDQSVYLQTETAKTTVNQPLKLVSMNTKFDLSLIHISEPTRPY